MSLTILDKIKAYKLVEIENDKKVKSLSDIEIIEIPYVFQEGLWKGWPSACGYYLNSLVTENYIYVPVYGLEEDEYVLELIQSYTNKEVVSINAEDVCFMGGSVRCLTWTTDGIDANKLLEFAEQN